MANELVTGNHAAGYALARAGEANRTARGAACGIYPITPQTEIVEYVAGFPFTKGSVVAAESEHSAMGITMGASVAGARAFTASSSNGLAYMVENIMVAGFYRLPVVMVAVNRTLGPPWNIWVDQGDTLMLRDFPWIQLYCEDNQEVADTVLQAFRLAEDPRVLLPAMVCMDAFITSHTQMATDLPDQETVDRYLPDLDLPHRLDPRRPRTLGGLAWPHETVSMRLEIDEAMKQAEGVFERSREEFRDTFGRDPGGAIQTFGTEDADRVLVTTGTITTTAREVIRRRREAGESVGLLKIKMFRPFPAAAIRSALDSATKVAVLDRNYAAGMGGVFWHDMKAALQGHRDDLLVQDYLTGVGGGDVTPAMISEILDDLAVRPREGSPRWMGISSGADDEAVSRSVPVAPEA